MRVSRFNFSYKDKIKKIGKTKIERIYNRLNIKKYLNDKNMTEEELFNIFIPSHEIEVKNPKRKNKF